MKVKQGWVSQIENNLFKVSELRESMIHSRTCKQLSRGKSLRLWDNGSGGTQRGSRKIDGVDHDDPIRRLTFIQSHFKLLSDMTGTAFERQEIWASLELEGPIRGCYNISVGENDGVAFKIKKKDSKDTNKVKSSGLQD